MRLVGFSELPENFRVKLSDKGEEELWHPVDEFGGIKNLSEAFGYPTSKIYNWKSKDLAIPIDFVKQIMGENNTKEIVMIKGKSSSSKIQNPDFPFQISEELLTRIEVSVTENSDETPVYITSEKSLVERFAELLENLGEVDYEVYSRDSRFELRYPKFLQKMFSKLDFEGDIAALVDERGSIENGKILLGDMEIDVNDFDQEIYSREKSFELALQRGDSEKIAELMAEESEKVRDLFEN